MDGVMLYEIPLYDLGEESLWTPSIQAGDEDIDISAIRFASSVGPASDSLIQSRTDGLNLVLNDGDDLITFTPGNALVELLHIPESNLLVPVQEVLILDQVIQRSQALEVEHCGRLRPDTPNLGEHILAPIFGG